MTHLLGVELVRPGLQPNDRLGRAELIISEASVVADARLRPDRPSSEAVSLRLK